MPRLFAVTLLALALAPAAAAQTSSKAVVGVEPFGPGAPVAAGSQFEASITLRIKAGFHINAQKPTEDYLVGTSLKLNPPAGVAVTKIDYPAQRFAKFSFSETPLAVYEGTVKITVSMKADATAAPGQISVPGVLTFQACNDQQCLPPAKVDVSLPAEIGAAAATTEVPADETKQTLTVVGAPPEAKVTIDGRQLGQTNAQGRFIAKDLKTGRHRVRVEHDGFKAWEQYVELDATQPQTVNVALVQDASAEPTLEQPAPASPAPAAQTPSTPAATPTPATQSPEPESGSNTALYVGAAVVLIALLGAGAYLAMRK
jgi:hypothetical protein